MSHENPDRLPEDPNADDDENSPNGTFNETDIDLEEEDEDEEKCEECGELLDDCTCEDE